MHGSLGYLSWASVEHALHDLQRARRLADGAQATL